MAVALLLVLTALAPSLVASSDYHPSDTQCLSGEDLGSLIQIHKTADASTAKKQVGAEDVSAVMLDFSHKMLSATSDGLQTYGASSFRQRVLIACISWLIYVVFALLVWSLIYPPAPEPLANTGDVEDPVQTFQQGHFQCLQRTDICLCACFCPGLRWADTMSLAGFLKISTGLTLVFFCALLNGFVNTTFALGPFTYLLALFYRLKLREQFGDDPWSLHSISVDVVYLLFCPWCALSQEARVVTNARQKGTLSM